MPVTWLTKYKLAQWQASTLAIIRFLMLRHILFIACLICGQIANGQDAIYGSYIGSGYLSDSLRFTIYLDLKPDGSYILKQVMRDSSITATGKWRKKGDNIKLKTKYSEADKKAAPAKTMVLNIESDALIWKPYKRKRVLKRKTKMLEKEMSKGAGEKVTLVDMSEPVILQKQNNRFRE